MVSETPAEGRDAANGERWTHRNASAGNERERPRRPERRPQRPQRPQRSGRSSRAPPVRGRAQVGDLTDDRRVGTAGAGLPVRSAVVQREERRRSATSRIGRRSSRPLPPGPGSSTSSRRVWLPADLRLSAGPGGRLRLACPRAPASAPQGRHRDRARSASRRTTRSIRRCSRSKRSTSMDPEKAVERGRSSTSSRRCSRTIGSGSKAGRPRSRSGSST